MTRVFISHSSDDAQLAAELHDWLRGLGHEVFLDRDLHGGQHQSHGRHDEHPNAGPVHRERPSPGGVASNPGPA